MIEYQPERGDNMNIDKIKEYAKTCKPYFETLNTKQKKQFIVSLPLNDEEFLCFVQTLLTSDSFNIHTSLEDMLSNKGTETSNYSFVR